MASQDDLVLMINQLLKAMDKMGDNLAVVKSIEEDVKEMKNRLKDIEAKISSRDELPTKSDIMSIKQSIDGKLKPMDSSVVENRLCKMEESISYLRCKDEVASKSDLLSIKETLDSKVKPLGEMKVTVTRLEKSMANLRCTTQFDATVKGRKVEFSSNFRTATRTRPIDSPGYAGMISNVILREDEVFQIKIDETVNYSDPDNGIAIGVIKDKKEEVKEKQAIFSRITGTWSIFSEKQSISGKSNTYKDNIRLTSDQYPLDTRSLPFGTILGVSRRGNGNVHFYLNGVDKGVAFKDVPKDVYAFVDVINYVTKVSIVN